MSEQPQLDLRRRRSEESLQKVPPHDATHEDDGGSDDEDMEMESGDPLDLPDLAAAPESGHADAVPLGMQDRASPLQTAAHSHPENPLTAAERAVLDNVKENLQYVGPNELRLLALHSFYRLRLYDHSVGEAARLTVASLGVTERNLRRWRKEGEASGHVPWDKRTDHSGQRKSQWILADDVEARRRLTDFIRAGTDERGKPNLTVHDITDYINNDLLKEYVATRPGKFKEFSDSTTARWIKKLGFEYQEYKKAGFVDGHEKEENVKARKEYVAEMLAIRKHNQDAAQQNAARAEQIRTIEEEVKKSTYIDYLGARTPRRVANGSTQAELWGWKCVE